MYSFRNTLLPLVLSLPLLVSAQLPAFTFPSGETGAQMRLLDGGAGEDGSYLAGVEIALEEGWKTYWRQPGDSGIPPTFDFSASTNVAALEVNWPAPSAHHDGFGWIVGYDTEVVFPVQIKAQDETRPVELVLALDYGVCHDICIPMEGNAAITLSQLGEHRPEVEKYLARVPVEIQEGDPRGGVLSVRQDRTGDQLVLEILVQQPKSGEAYLLLAEGPSDWRVPVPEMMETLSDGTARFHLVLDDVPDADDLSDVALKVTGVSSSFSFEQTVVLE